VDLLVEQVDLLLVDLLLVVNLVVDFGYPVLELGL